MIHTLKEGKDPHVSRTRRIHKVHAKHGYAPQVKHEKDKTAAKVDHVNTAYSPSSSSSSSSKRATPTHMSTAVRRIQFQPKRTRTSSGCSPAAPLAAFHHHHYRFRCLPSRSLSPTRYSPSRLRAPYSMSANDGFCRNGRLCFCVLERRHMHYAWSRADR
jgi:hypothetical protein